MKLPKSAKRVFKGKIFDVYHWPQKMFDGSVVTFEMLKRPDTVQVIATDGRHIFMAREEQPGRPVCLTLCGGRIESGEKPLTAAKRELREESGLISSDWELINSAEPSTKMDWTVYTFVARGCRFVAEPTLDAGEKITLKKVTLEEFCEIVISDQFWGREFTQYLFRLLYRDPRGLKKFKNKLGMD